MLTDIGNEHLENYFLEVFAAKFRNLLWNAEKYWGQPKLFFLHTICEIGENSGIFEISGMFEAFQLDTTPKHCWDSKHKGVFILNDHITISSFQHLGVLHCDIVQCISVFWNILVNCAFVQFYRSVVLHSTFPFVGCIKSHKSIG